jgi:hypothetical protein
MYSEDRLEETCTVCLVEHDEDIHSATISLREWHRAQVTKYFYEEFAPAAA